MTLLRTIPVALSALTRNKLRSLLTVLGIVIGVGAVIAMVSIGEGAKARVAKTFENIGTNMLVLRSGSSSRGGVRGGAGSRQSITWDDLEAVRRVAAVKYAAPVQSSSAQAQSEDQNWQTSVQGTSPELFEIRNWPAKSGRVLTDVDVANKAKVAVLGTTVVENLFGAGADPIGQTVRINRVPFVVVGVASSKGTSGFGGDNDDVVFVPITTFNAKIQGGLGRYIRGSIYIGATSPDATKAAQSGIEQVLRQRHRIKAGQDDDFRVRDLADLASAQQQSAETITSLLLGVALVSLVVGGIGIMNIMLVSVTERTREIGLRMAVGGRRRDILAQFLVEAVVLCLIGGLIGVTIGVLATVAIAQSANWPVLIAPEIVAVALAASALTGIVFGFVPARRAAHLNPIDALRSE